MAKHRSGLRFQPSGGARNTGVPVGKKQRLRIERIDRGDLIIDFHLVFAVPKLVIQPPQLMQHLLVARIFFEQRPQRENPDLRPARRHRRFLQEQICLTIVRFPF